MMSRNIVHAIHIIIFAWEVVSEVLGSNLVGSRG